MENTRAPAIDFFFPKSHFSIILNIIDPLPSRSGKSSVEKSHPGSRCFVFDNIVVTSRRETGSYRTGPPLNLYCKSKRDTNVFYVDQIYIRFFVIFLNIGSEIDDVRQIRRKNTNGCNSDRDWITAARLRACFEIIEIRRRFQPPARPPPPSRP